jgi:hypothetical protein
VKKKLTTLLLLIAGLVLVSHPETTQADTSKKLNFKIYHKENKGFSPQGMEIDNLVETDKAYVFTVSHGSNAPHQTGVKKNWYLISGSGRRYNPIVHEDYMRGGVWHYTVTYPKDSNLIGVADVNFGMGQAFGGGSYTNAAVRFDTGKGYGEKETINSVVLYKGLRARKVHNQYPIDVPQAELNDAISEVRLPAGISITLYEDANYGGASETISNRTDRPQFYYVSGAMNGKASSYKITSNYVKLYKNYNGDGELTKHKESFLSVSSMGSDDNQVSSVALPARTTITLYENSNFTGKAEVISNFTDHTAVYNVSSSFNDKASSYDISEVIPKGVYNKKVTSIQSKKDVWKVLDWSMSNHDQVLTYHNSGNANQKWNFFYDASDDTYQIMCGPLKLNGRIKAAYLTAGVANNTISTTNPKAEKSREKWRLIKVGTHANGDVFMLRNVKTGKVLDMPGSKSGVPLGLYKSFATDNQKFVVHVEK